jgi:hypothetical protein
MTSATGAGKRVRTLTIRTSKSKRISARRSLQVMAVTVVSVALAGFLECPIPSYAQQWHVALYQNPSALIDSRPGVARLARLQVHAFHLLDD